MTTTTIDPPGAVQRPAAVPIPKPLTPEAEARFQRLYDGLIDGTIPLWALPSWMLATYSLGFDDGRASRQAEVNEANDEADRLWVRLSNEPPSDGPTLVDLKARRAARLAQHLAELADVWPAESAA